MKAQDFNYWKNRANVDQGDWLDGVGDWVKGYFNSADHPHRSLILNTIKNLGNVTSVLDVGCSSGPNLMLLKHKLGIETLAGLDANAASIEYAKQKLPSLDLRLGDLLFLPWPDDAFDVVLYDAVLMYLNRQAIGTAVREAYRVAKRAIIIVDRFNRSPLGKLLPNGFNYARDYGKLLKNYGMQVTVEKITKADWPTSENWQKHGFLWYGVKKMQKEKRTIGGAPTTY